MSISEARGRLASIIDDARHEPVYLTRRNKRVAAVVDAAVLDRLLEAAEDLDDLVAYDEAVAESARIGGENVKWDDLKRELGLGDVLGRGHPGRATRHPQAPARRTAADRGAPRDPRRAPPATRRTQAREPARMASPLGDYRLIYRIDDGKLVVVVVDAGHRREVYRDR